MEPEVFHTKAVGVTFEGRQYVIQTLERLGKADKDKVKLTLRREPDNEYDKNAISIDVTYYDPTFLTEVTKSAGYIRKEINEEIAWQMDKGTEFEIINYETTGGYKKTRGLNISIMRKEDGMAKLTVDALLSKKGNTNYKDTILKMSPNTSLSLRFLLPLSKATMQATHSIEMPAGWGRKYERFECLKYVHEDDSVDCPADKINEPWVKLILPVLDRSDGKVKLFRETPAVFKKLQMFEETPANDMEKSVKLGDLTRADIQIMQQGAGKDRQINAFPLPQTIRDLNAEEKEALKGAPDAKSIMRIVTSEEIQKIVDAVVAGNTPSGQAATMNVSGPLDN